MLLIVAILGAIGAALFGRQPRWLAHLRRRMPALPSRSNSGAGLPGPAVALTPPAKRKGAAQ